MYIIEFDTGVWYDFATIEELQSFLDDVCQGKAGPSCWSDYRIIEPKENK